MISIEHLYFAYDRGPYLLHDVNMTVGDGEYISIVGENGSGKSTLLKLILGLLTPSKGQITNTFRHLAYVPQRFDALNSQFPITVYEVLDCYRRVLGLRGTNDVMQCLEQMHIVDLKDRLIGNLSGGQCQKVMIARALLGKPDLLVFDEPSTGIDVKSQMELYPFIKALNRDQHITVITVEHNLKFAVHSADKMFHVIHGQGHFCTPHEYIHEYVSDNVGREFDVRNV